jgi:uncharacterized surface protein with fasciclin (FAS1) repeats
MIPHLSRLAALAAAAALTVTLTGCAEEAPTNIPPPPPPGAPPLPGEPGALDGAAPVVNVYGPECESVTAPGVGATDLAGDPVGTVTANSPVLSRLNEAVVAADLVDTLNDPNASYTVFAPANSAFDALAAGTLEQLLADPQGQLTDILTYHVAPQRYDAQALAGAGTVTTVQGSELTITGDQGSLVIDEQEQASVLCGNIPTANGTVFVIDKVLMP